MTSRAAPLLFLLAGLVGCAAPRLSARFPMPIRYGGAGARVVIAPITDPRPNRLEASVGYQGLFQARSDWEVNEETPPALVVQQALATDLAQRGLPQAAGGYEVRCQMPQFLLRYRNYAGAYSATDGWGYLDLVCSVTASGQRVWEGPIYARYHKAFYFFGGPGRSQLVDELWPELTGALVQQAATILNRVAFHQPASPQAVAQGRQLLASSEPDDRFNGAYLLGIAGDPSAVPLLVRALGDPEEKVRRSVVDALGTLGAVETLPALLQRYDREEGNVKWAILKSILQMGDPSGFEWLRRKVASIDSDTLREIAEDTLRHPAQAPPPPAVPAAPPPPAVPVGSEAPPPPAVPVAP